MAWTYVAHERVESSTDTITIPVSGYDLYRVTVYSKHTGTDGQEGFRFNGDTGNNYATQYIRSTATSTDGALVSMSHFSKHVTSPVAGEPSLVTAIIGKPLAGKIAKVIAHSSTNSSSVVLSIHGGDWSNTAALLTSITLFAAAGDFAAGSLVLVEGLAT